MISKAVQKGKVGSREPWLPCWPCIVEVTVGQGIKSSSQYCFVRILGCVCHTLIVIVLFGTEREASVKDNAKKLKGDVNSDCPSIDDK